MDQPGVLIAVDGSDTDVIGAVEVAARVVSIGVVALNRSSVSKCGVPSGAPAETVTASAAGEPNTSAARDSPANSRSRNDFMIYVSPITYDVNVPNTLVAARFARRH